jgi:hypothetical protein
MKKVLVALMAVAAIGSAQAQHYGHGHRHHGHGNVAGAVIGGMILGAVIERASQPVYVPQPQVIYQQTYPQPEYRTAPVYSNQYPAPISCIPAYDQFGRYLGCIR